MKARIWHKGFDSSVICIGESQQCLQTDFMVVYNYGWGNNEVECQKNMAFTVGNVCAYVGYMATSDKTICYRKPKICT